LALPPTTDQRLSTADPLPRDFYLRDPREVARDLLGKLLVRREGKSQLAGRIVEVEAYLGTDDPAAHSAAGRTARNEVLFGPPGHAYVYFIYGVHYCLNVSCMAEGDAGCVLIRALEPISGFEKMARNRKIKLSAHPTQRELRQLTSGPGRLAQGLAITRPRDNGKDMTARSSDLQILDDGFQAERISTSKRIGITKAAEAPLRFTIAGNAFVSR
jgi:DNA-3-methyladenine glycosylase